MGEGIAAGGVAGIDSLAELGSALRQLRRRHARQCGDSPVTYRELAARTGYAVGAIGDYFGGKALPSTDRLDVLARLLGASPAEQGMLATARDRIEDGRRAHGSSSRTALGEQAQGRASLGAAGTTVGRADTATANGGAAPGGGAVPRQLPAGARHLTGRDGLLGRLARVAGGGVVAIDGMAGIGKTALAVAAARQVAARYPDGTLFVDLYGYSGRQPTAPGDALEALLRALGVPGQWIPEDPDARIGLWRTVTAQRALLIVLDNARDEAQVRPLLPGSPTCLVIVTSRWRMAGLDDADHLTLGVLRREDAAALFRAIAPDPGDDQLVEEIVELCGLLPLAVRIAATRLKISSTLDARTLLEQLRLAREGVLADGERSVMAALEVSFRHLTADQQRAFAALGQHPGVDFEPYATAALLGTTPPRARTLLDDLEHVNLLHQPAAGRYRFHDLTRLYAGRQAGAQTDADLRGLYDHYAATASAAAELAYPYERYRRPGPAGVPVVVPLTDRAAAVAWLDTELSNMVATALFAGDHGRPGHTLHQAATLYRHLTVRGRHAVARGLDQLAVELAGRSGDTVQEGKVLCRLALANRYDGRYQLGLECGQRALDLARATGDAAAESEAYLVLGLTYMSMARYQNGRESMGRAMDLATGRGDVLGEGRARCGLGILLTILGEYAEAAEHLARAQEIAGEHSDGVGQLAVLSAIGQLRLVQGELRGAHSTFAEALRLAVTAGDVNWQLEAHFGIGRVLLARGEYDRAAATLEQALEFAELQAKPPDQVRVLYELGRAHSRADRYAEARERWRRALELLAAVGASAAEEVTEAEIRAALAGLEAPHGSRPAVALLGA